MNTQGYEVRYKILDREYSVFQQSIEAVDKLVALLKARGIVFTVCYATVDNESGRIVSRGCQIDGCQTL